MATTFKQARNLQGVRVRMHFDDGREVVAMLLCATKDIDGSKHLVYDKVEDGTGIETSGASRCYCVDARTLVSVEPADATRQPRSPRGLDTLSLRKEIEKSSQRALRPSA